LSALPEPLVEILPAALRAAGDETPVRTARVISGGCINNATYLETTRRAYLLKWNTIAAPDFFEQEVRGLRLLAAANAVRVPAPYLTSAGIPMPPSGAPAFVLLEWLQPSGAQDSALLGEQLAALHRHDILPAGLEGFTAPPGPAYGLDHDNMLGSTPQLNEWKSDWVEFFIECRIRPQMELAARTGRLTSNRRLRLEHLLVRLPGLLGGVQRQPSLIHGDLWSGNIVHGPGGLALIDPAVSFSDREAELAYTELFGGFSRRFYEAYNAAWPLEPGYEQRRALYNLYHLLNHLNLFGETYGPGVDTVLRRYAPTGPLQL
jgi:fructosamine-3-kinase